MSPSYSAHNEWVAMKQQTAAEVAQIEKWWSEPRWAHTKRNYTAEDVAKRRGTFPVLKSTSTVMADKMYALLDKHARDGTASQTFGALDPVHVTQMAKYLDSVYVSGWQCSATASTSHEPGPDFADYPMDTVPNKVEHLIKSQLFHDRKQREARLSCTTPEQLNALGPEIDYLRPIIADADAGHGGLNAVYKLTKLFIERGAAGIHMEDQTSTNKKCGHMAGRCVVPVQEHVNRLIMSRLCADVMGSNLLLVARTDSGRATLISSTIDNRDHYFILGATNPEVTVSLADTLAEAQAAGASSEELQELEARWNEKARLRLFHEIFSEKVKNNPKIFNQSVIANFNSRTGPYSGKSIQQMQAIARELIGEEIYFNWDLPRSSEGLYRYNGGIECSIMRARAFSPYADLVWMESDSPDFEEARQFAVGVREKYPHQWLAYNLSPSFNWPKAMPPHEQETFITRLAKLGYNWQFITLAGLHTTALAVHSFSREYKKFGMKAYAVDVQQREIDESVDILKHQKWAGAEYVDGLLKLALGGVSATAAMGKGVTEEQFNSVTNSARL
ncbi:HCL163Wp [Eremothecium sinecaudum]|uniref:Isocitrate lyase n=1 Tax=Eremothecium sinecaudum TaxID=45286 RepID=A0A0X8HRB2_9SACH|nr:HCL163Wp [Eremothecium sinecaudum]AMD19988.1 HCL163Wp [Eremothecium sinecaudum]